MTEEPKLDAAVENLLASAGLSHEKTLNRGGWANGDVFLVCRGERRLVLKTYAARSPLFRAIGRLLLGRERRAYRVLAGIAGVPALAPCEDSASLLIQYVPAEKISNDLLERRGPAIIASLRRVLAEAHERGVFHMDLRNQGNILVDENDGAWLVDFASAVVIRRRHPGAWLMAHFGERFDRYGLSKWEARAGMG